MREPQVEVPHSRYTVPRESTISIQQLRICIRPSSRTSARNSIVFLCWIGRSTRKIGRPLPGTWYHLCEIRPLPRVRDKTSLEQCKLRMFRTCVSRNTGFARERVSRALSSSNKSAFRNASIDDERNSTLGEVLKGSCVGTS